MKKLMICCLLAVIATTSTYGQDTTLSIYDTFRITQFTRVTQFTFAGARTSFTFDFSSDTFKFGGTMPPDSAALHFLDWISIAYPTRLQAYRDTVATLRKRLSQAQETDE